MEEDDEGVRYKTLSLTRGRAREEAVVEEAVQVLSSINYHLDGRFKDTLLSNDVIHSVLVFDPSIWPPTAKELASYGEEKISTIFHHYRVPLEKAGHSLANCLVQWGELKVIIRRKLSFGRIKFLDLCRILYTNTLKDSWIFWHWSKSSCCCQYLQLNVRGDSAS